MSPLRSAATAKTVTCEWASVESAKWDQWYGNLAWHLVLKCVAPATEVGTLCNLLAPTPHQAVERTNSHGNLAVWCKRLLPYPHFTFSLFNNFPLICVWQKTDLKNVLAFCHVHQEFQKSLVLRNPRLMEASENTNFLLKQGWGSIHTYPPFSEACVFFPALIFHVFF